MNYLKTDLLDFTRDDLGTINRIGKTLIIEYHFYGGLRLNRKQDTVVNWYFSIADNPLQKRAGEVKLIIYYNNNNNNNNTVYLRSAIYPDVNRVDVMFKILLLEKH